MRGLLVTGATGTFGRAFIRRVLRERFYDRVVAYSRDEVKQAALLQEFCGEPRMFLGDVRDSARLAMAMRGVSTVVHSAALKRVDVGAYSPSEMVATNVTGTMNVVNAAIRAGVDRVVVLSSDKSVNATNIYGATKYLGECYAVHANAYGFPSGTRIAAVRYGNILGSRGSVIDVWRKQIAADAPMVLTDRRMTRFVMTIEQAVELVLFALEHMQGGDVFVPHLPSATLLALARAVAPTPDYPTVETGVRPGGEKFAESLLNEEEPTRTRWYEGHYVIAPSQHEWVAQPRWQGDPVSSDLTYRSDGADQRWMQPEEIRSLLAQTEAGR